MERSESMREFSFLNVIYSKVLSACESQTHCVLQFPINCIIV